MVFGKTDPIHTDHQFPFRYDQMSFPPALTNKRTVFLMSQAAVTIECSYQRQSMIFIMFEFSWGRLHHTVMETPNAIWANDTLIILGLPLKSAYQMLYERALESHPRDFAKCYQHALLFNLSTPVLVFIGSIIAIDYACHKVTHRTHWLHGV